MGGWRVLTLSIEDAGQEHDDGADEGERNGRCEQATNPDADRSHLGKPLNSAPGISEFCTLLCLWFTISLDFCARSRRSNSEPQRLGVDSISKLMLRQHPNAREGGFYGAFRWMFVREGAL
jgi:hypothetical protein